MKVFVTGASGFIGSATVRELVGAGHQVVGLARSDAAATIVAAAGADVVRGGLDDLDSLKRAAAASDGVIHTAFIHDFTDFAASCAADKLAIEALGAALAGTSRPLVVTSGVLGLASKPGVEDDSPSDGFPRKSEQTALAFAGHGVRVSCVRLAPSVHGDGDHGFVPQIIAVARKQGRAIYVGDGKNRWPGVHRFDAATLFRLALEKGVAGARFHGVADEGVPVRAIAEVIARRLHLPAVSVTAEEAGAALGFIGHVLAADAATSSAKTRAALGWTPTHVGLLDDLEHGTYFSGSAS